MCAVPLALAVTTPPVVGMLATEGASDAQVTFAVIAVPLLFLTLAETACVALRTSNVNGPAGLISTEAGVFALLLPPVFPGLPVFPVLPVLVFESVVAAPQPAMRT